MVNEQLVHVFGNREQLVERDEQLDAAACLQIVNEQRHGLRRRVCRTLPDTAAATQSRSG